MSVAQPKYPIGQTVRISPEITGTGTETGHVARFTEVTEGGHKRFVYEVVTPDITYQNCPEEKLYPNFIISSIL